MAKVAEKTNLPPSESEKPLRVGDKIRIGQQVARKFYSLVLLFLAVSGPSKKKNCFFYPVVKPSKKNIFFYYVLKPSKKRFFFY